MTDWREAFQQGAEEAWSKSEEPKKPNGTYTNGHAKSVGDDISTEEQKDFRITPAGVYMQVVKKSSKKDEPPEIEWVWIASPIQVVAETRNASGKAWGRLLRWRDRDVTVHEWAMPMKMLAGQGIEYREELLSGGVELAPGANGKHGLHTYLLTWKPKHKARCVERTGWHDEAFVLPDQSCGEAGDERLLLQLEGAAPQFDVAGSLDGWKEDIGRLAEGNSRLMFAISLAFAAPLLRLLGEESGGVHLWGPSSIGKTTLLRVAASVLGTQMRSWRATSNGLEAAARGSCDTLLVLDEIGQVTPHDLDAAAYLLGNGVGKARMKRDATAREVVTWRVLFMSTGEVGLSTKLGEVGKRARAGQFMRLIEVPANAGDHGVFEDLHGFSNGDALARHLKDATERHCGHAGREFIAKLAADFQSQAARAAAYKGDWIEAHVEPDADGQVLRAAGRFAAIAAAGEMAQEWGIVPWEPGAAGEAASKCFEAWLGSRGGEEPHEVIEGLAQVRKFLEEHGSNRFELAWNIRYDRDNNEIPDRVPNRAGFRRLNEKLEYEHYVLPEAWRREVCKGFDPTMIAKAMIARGWMEAGDGKNLARRMAIPRHGKPRLYRILPSFLEGAE
jgi:putative DNA primase/helicase